METSIAMSGGNILFLKHSRNFPKCIETLYVKIEDLYWQIITPPNMTGEAVLRLTTSLCWYHERYFAGIILRGILLIMRSIVPVL